MSKPTPSTKNRFFSGAPQDRLGPTVVYYRNPAAPNRNVLFIGVVVVLNPLAFFTGRHTGLHTWVGVTVGARA